MNNKTENKQDQGIIKNNSELDSTLLVMGGLFIAILIWLGVGTILGAISAVVIGVLLDRFFFKGSG